MNTSDQDRVTDRMNTLARESTQTFIDAAYLAQQQSMRLFQAWLDTLNENQQQQRDIATRLLQQTQEAQGLLQQFVQQTVQSSADTARRATQSGLNAASQNMNQAAQQASAVSDALRRAGDGDSSGS